LCRPIRLDRASRYLAAVRHPWPCLVFIVPLLAVYEVGVARLAHENGESPRAGVELWLRQWLTQSGPYPPFPVPAALVFLLGAWPPAVESVRRCQSPNGAGRSSSLQAQGLKESLRLPGPVVLAGTMGLRPQHMPVAHQDTRSLTLFLHVSLSAGHKFLRGRRRFASGYC